MHTNDPARQKLRCHECAVLLIFVALGLAAHGSAQLSYTGGLVSQSFDTLLASGTFTFTGKGPAQLDQAPISAAGTQGWSIYARVGSPLKFLVDSGTLGTASVYSHGSMGATDRALGSLGGSHVANLGLRLVNDTGQTITQFTVAFRGEQWRRGDSAAPGFLEFGYRINATPFDIDSTATFTTVSALNFTAPNANSVPTSLNGNLAVNRAELSATVTGITWPAGHTLALRWRDFDETGADDGISIDDVVFFAPTTPTVPQVAQVQPASGATGVVTSSRIRVTFDQPVNVSGAWYQLVGSTSGVVAATAMGGPLRYEIIPSVRLANGDTFTLTVFASQVTNTSGTPMAANAASSFMTIGANTNPQAIHTVQGNALSTPLASTLVTVSGVVTADFQGPPPALGGFFVQHLPADEDADPATSEGIFVYDFNAEDSENMAVGDLVLVTGTAREFGAQTELSNIVSVIKQGTAALPPVVDVTLPAATSTALEPLEGMRVRFPQTLAVTSNSGDGGFTDTFARSGQLILAAASPLRQATDFIDPNDVPASGTNSTGTSNVAAVTAQADLNQRSSIVLDDSSDATLPDPTPYLNAQGTRRCGDTVTNLMGVLSFADGRYRIEPTETVTFIDANPRPAAPPAVAGRLKVAAMNVLNYFTTFGQRGASNAAEFQRQKDKIIAALSILNADILGLIEIENNPTAVNDLTSALNTAMGADTYAIVPDPPGGPGGDAIRLVLLYKPAVLALSGSALTDSDPVWNTPNPLRPPLAQVFAELSSGERFTVCLNHFKSKTATDATGANLDQGDGQGAWNDLRRQQAARLDAFLDAVRAATGDNDALVIGDLNSYGEEDPLDVLRGLGYADQAARFESAPLSYRFGMERGRLDHAFATSTMEAQIVAAAHWHINADEPAFYDYNLESKSAAQQAINVGTPFRSSDHDPLLIGIDLSPQPTTFAMWVASIEWPGGANTQPDGDPDGDGATNLEEFVSNSNPLTSDMPLRPAALLSGADFILQFRLRQTASGVTVAAEWSDDLLNWHSMGTPAMISAIDNITSLYRATQPQGSSARLFGRLRITMP